MTKLVKPTESELDILTILWEKERATVKEVHEIMLSHKKIGYTTTLKLMQIMNEKGLVVRDIQSKKHIYTPLIKKDKLQALYLSKMIQTLFGGSSTELVLQAIEKYPHTEKDLISIASLVKQLQKNN
jgi:predicted transcriptional regulator